MHCMVEKAGIFVGIDEWVAGSFVCESRERVREQVCENSQAGGIVELGADENGQDDTCPPNFGLPHAVLRCCEMKVDLANLEG